VFRLNILLSTLTVLFEIMPTLSLNNTQTRLLPQVDLSRNLCATQPVFLLFSRQCAILRNRRASQQAETWRR